MLLANRILGPQTTPTSKSDVVFIHGTGSNSDMWESQAQVLAALGHRCFLIDLRGHGGSPGVFECTSIECHLTDVMETVEQCHVRFPAIFIGHSLGAIIAFELAERHPEMFDQIFAAG